ncbi:thioredoxin domain-containing protein [Candidatus Bathyarchaeota archaeon]|nr:thioredoxin domain-containing protein [Candidatus Bathyarchaeota archaeon]
MYHYYSDGKRHLPGLLTDQAHMIKCLIDAYQSTFDRKFLNYAETIAKFMIKKLWDDTGGFYDRPKDTETLGALKTLYKPIDENSVAADALLRLYYLTGNERYLEISKRTLEHFSSSYQMYGIMAASYGSAIELYLNPVQIHIVGSKKDPLTRRFMNESLKVFNPLKVIEHLDPAHDAERLTRLQYPATRKTIAYVCIKGTCITVENPTEIAELLGPKIL